MYVTISIIVLFFVTYLPRVLPLIIFKKDIKSRYIRSFLYYIPYAVLTGLTFPLVFYATGNLVIGIIGTSVAIALAFFKQKLIIVALAAVLVVYGLSYLL